MGRILATKQVVSYCQRMQGNVLYLPFITLLKVLKSGHVMWVIKLINEDQTAVLQQVKQKNQICVCCYVFLVTNPCF